MALLVIIPKSGNLCQWQLYIGRERRNWQNPFLLLPAVGLAVLDPEPGLPEEGRVRSRSKDFQALPWPPPAPAGSNHPSAFHGAMNLMHPVTKGKMTLLGIKA